MEKRLRYYPDSGLLNYQLAIASRSLGEDDKAQDYIKKALESDPSNKDYINLNKELSDNSDSKDK